MKRIGIKRLAGGAAIGAVNGIFGGGGGMVAVPLLERTGYPTRRAHATAIAVILPTSLVSGFVYCLYGLTPLFVLIPVAVGVAVGGFLGARLLPVLPLTATDLIFAALMLAAGLRLVLP